MMRIVLCINLFLSAVISIDINEKLGKCISGFTAPHVHKMQQNEGIWFPQYRTRDSENTRYTCHTIYEKMEYGDPTTIYSESYYTQNDRPIEDPYVQSYRQHDKNVLVDDEYENQDESYKVYNYIIAINSEYRVRYLCTDHQKSTIGAPLVYVETRNSSPSWEKIKHAFVEVQQAGLHVTLDRIDQRNCKRPLGYDGYGKTNGEGISKS